MAYAQFMYSKLYRQLFTSSVMEEDLITRYVWLCLIALADKEGIVDMTRESLARTLNMDVGQLNLAIDRLLAPDLASRSKKNEGRRLSPLDQDRNWGWTIVNYVAYRDIKNEEEKREYMKNYMRMRRELENVKSPLNDVNRVSPSDAEEDSDKDEDESKDKPKEEKKESSTTPPAKVSEHSDHDFWESLKTNVAYQHIDFESEKGKMSAWLSLPKNNRRQMTRSFVLNWFNKIEKPIGLPEKPKLPENMKGLEEWMKEKGLS